MYNEQSNKERFAKFTEELAELSKKYNVVIRSTGGVTILDKEDKIESLEYSSDATSGELDVEEFGFTEG